MDIDYPTTGAWGQTDRQWQEQRTSYEKLLDEQQAIEERLTTLALRENACIVLQTANRDYTMAFQGMLNSGEITSFEKQFAYLEARRVLCREQYNNASNDLRKVKTKIYNHR
jgi:hypothetical protein